ncbi:MAG: WD40 repeat domain-containing protein [Planctomycetota bacterium]
MDQNAEAPVGSASAPPTRRVKRRWFRFSLQTLLIFALLIGSGMGLWWKWEPWVVGQTVVCAKTWSGGSVFSADGTLAAFWSWNPYERSTPTDPPILYTPELQVYEVATLRKVSELSGLLQGISSLIFSPEGTQLLAVSHDDGGFIWDVRSGSLLRRLEYGGHLCGSFSPDGTKLLLLNGSDSLEKVLLCDLTSTAPAGFLELPDVVRSVSWSPDSKHLLSLCDSDKQIVLLDARSLKRTGGVGTTTDLYSGAGFFPDGVRFWATTYENQAIVFDAADCRELWRVHYSEFWSDVLFAPDGKSALLLCDSENRLAMSDASLHPRFALAPRLGLSGKVWFSEDGPRVLAVDNSGCGSVHIWDSRTGKHLAQLRSSDSDTYIHDATLSPNCARIAIADRHRLKTFSRRRPEYWWGVAWLPEFWLTAVLALAFAWSVWQDRKTL